MHPPMHPPLHPHPESCSHPPTRAEALRFWFKLGWIGFGGPAGQIALLHRVVVDEKRWVSEARFQHALSYCMLLPGPEAQQLTTYLGWLMHGRAMGVAAGLLFILPAWVLMTLLGCLYMVHAGQPAVGAVLAGLKPAVVALVAHAAWRLGRRQLGHPLALGVAGGACAGLLVGLPFPLLLVVAAAVGAAAQHRGLGGWAAPPAPAAGDGAAPLSAPPAGTRGVLVAGLLLGLGPLAALLLWQGPQGFFPALGLFFTKAALVTFGGAYAVLPYVAQAAVQQWGWITTAQLMDGLALGETTPGPLVIVLVFIGVVAGWQQPGADPLVWGVGAALVAGWFTFLPSFVFILAGAPWVERTRQLPALAGPLRAVAAAVVGVIVHLGLVLAAQALWPQGRIDAWACALALLCVLALQRVPVLGVVLAAAGAGLVLPRS